MAELPEPPAGSVVAAGRTVFLREEDDEHGAAWRKVGHLTTYGWTDVLAAGDVRVIRYGPAELPDDAIEATPPKSTSPWRGTCYHGQSVPHGGCQGPVATPEPVIHEAALLAKHAAYISRTVTASYPEGMDPELVMRRRVGKIFVESGELGDAVEGWTGENPRKGVYATREDVIKELIDCASASLCAIEYMTGDAGLSVGMVAKQVVGNAQRLSESIPDRCDPDAGPVATPTEPAESSWQPFRNRDDWLRDQHARYHDEPGNLLGRDDCEWQRCGFWDAATLVLDALSAGAPVPAEPPRKALTGWFDVTQVPAEQPADCACPFHWPGGHGAMPWSTPDQETKGG